MKNLLLVIERLIVDNSAVCDFCDKNTALIDSSDIVEMDRLTAEFQSFLGGYIQRNNSFREEMKRLGLDNIRSISSCEGYSSEELTHTLSQFDKGVRLSKSKINDYGKKINIELNLINKVKRFQTDGNIDFKL